MAEIPESDLTLSSFKTKNPLTSFSYEPENVHFLDQDPGEKIILFLRWHPITNLGWILTALVLFLAPSFLGSFSIFSSLPLNYRFIVVLLWYLIATAYTYEKFLHWYFSAFLITNRRVIDIDFVNLIYREISFASLERIQDVTMKVGGGGMTIFNYGSVFIQTAGEIPNVEFERVPHPNKVVKILKGLLLQNNQTGRKEHI